MMNKREMILTACSGVILATTLVSAPVNAGPKDYIAKLDPESGKYCAYVEVRQPNGLGSRKRKCRTLEGWEAMGYVISQKKQEEE